MQAHFPTRWKYDYLRALYVFALLDVEYIDALQPALDHLMKSLKRGKLLKGSTYSGLTHFPYETERFGRMNTFRAYYVLKKYRPGDFARFLYQAY